MFRNFSNQNILQDRKKWKKNVQFSRQEKRYDATVNL